MCGRQLTEETLRRSQTEIGMFKAAEVVCLPFAWVYYTRLA